MESLDSLHKFDLFGVGETYLTPDVSNDELATRGF